MNTLGEKTVSTFLKEVESHKLHQEFTAGAAIKQGQPVILSGDDEVIEPAAADEVNMNIIGYAVHDAEADELVTIGMRGFTIIWAQADDVLVAGPVRYSGFDATTGLNMVTNPAGTPSTAANYIGWAIDDGADEDKIRVVLR